MARPHGSEAWVISREWRTRGCLAILPDGQPASTARNVKRRDVNTYAGHVGATTCVTSTAAADNSGPLPILPCLILRKVLHRVEFPVRSQNEGKTED